MLAHDEQAIIAQCTPKGPGAIGLLRISGTNALDIAQKIAKLPHNKSISQLPSHTIHYGSVVDHTGDTIDHVLFLLMHGPRTFTGQDTVEITCHNNQFIIDAIIAAALNAGARMAQEGEFTKRAVLNDKIDLLQAEAVNELIHANSQKGVQQSLAQLDGTLSNELEAIQKRLITALAFTNASFEFIDEENLEFASTIASNLNEIRNTIARLKKSFDQQKQIRDGIRIALIGSVNAGKSSLFNALIGTNRAIVTSQAGTTRDSIEAGFYEHGAYWTLVDTAGLRETDNEIEKEGIRRSLQEAHKADIVLLVIDGARELSDQEQAVYQEIYQTHTHKIIPIINKTDISQQITPLFTYSLNCSAQRGHGIHAIKKAIFEKSSQLFASLESPYLINKRQFNAMSELDSKLDEIVPLLEGDIAYELIAYHLTEAIAHCGQLTGRTVDEQAMDAVFKEFCVGK